ncbi:MAG TPA: hypothetical protein VFJ43_08785 [Bacteroidia bacterium]|nr:hypothetical protein [Bacteroidia bacterium]
MRILLNLFCCLLIPVFSFSQSASLSKCWRYEIKCSHDPYLNHSVEGVKNQPDTSYQLSIEEVIKLNDFLQAHKLYKTPDADPEKHFDIRLVFLFGDEAGKRHELGFDCDGNYELDGISYSFNDKIATALDELKNNSIQN